MAFTFGPTNQGGALFGCNLVQMARLRDLEVGEAKPVTSADDLPPAHRALFATALAFIEGETAAAKIAYVLEMGDTVTVRAIKDTAHDRAFSMYLTDVGGNVYGFITPTEGAELAAQIEDGAIQSNPAFENYKALPWFITN